MCYVLFYVTNFFATCLEQLDIIIVTYHIYDLKLVVNVRILCNEIFF